MADALSDAFAALADPTRRALLEALTRGEATVNELAEPFAMSLQAISKHLKVLEAAGLISRGRDAQRRPCRLRPGPLAEATGYLAHYRRFWEASFDALADHLAATGFPAEPGVLAATAPTATTAPPTPAPPTPRAGPTGAAATTSAGKKAPRSRPASSTTSARPTPTRGSTRAPRSPRQEGSS